MTTVTKESTFVCSDCGKEKDIPEDSITTGYGIDNEGKKVCFACCGLRDRKTMVDEGRIALYLTKKPDGWFVTNWPGTLSFRVTSHRIGSHNIAGTRDDVWFTGPDDKPWWGVCIGSNTQITRCRRIKG